MSSWISAQHVSTFLNVFYQWNQSNTQRWCLCLDHTVEKSNNDPQTLMLFMCRTEIEIILLCSHKISLNFSPLFYYVLFITFLHKQMWWWITFNPVFTELRHVYCPYAYVHTNRLSSVCGRGITVNVLKRVRLVDLRCLQRLFLLCLTGGQPKNTFSSFTRSFQIHFPQLWRSKCSFDCTSCSASCERVSVMVTLSCLKCGLFFLIQMSFKHITLKSAHYCTVAAASSPLSFSEWHWTSFCVRAMFD